VTPCPREVNDANESVNFFFGFLRFFFFWRVLSFWVRSQADHVVIGAVPEGSDYVPCGAHTPAGMIHSVP